MSSAGVTPELRREIKRMYGIIKRIEAGKAVRPNTIREALLDLRRAMAAELRKP